VAIKQYPILGELAKLNEHDAANRANKFGGAALKNRMTELVRLQLLAGPRITKPCYIGFRWFYSGKHDFDNIRFATKYVLDGMVKAGVLVNDSQKYVLGFTGDEFIKVPKGEEGVVVIVKEKDDE